MAICGEKSIFSSEVEEIYNYYGHSIKDVVILYIRLFCTEHIARSQHLTGVAEASKVFLLLLFCKTASKFNRMHKLSSVINFPFD